MLIVTIFETLDLGIDVFFWSRNIFDVVQAGFKQLAVGHIDSPSIA